MFKMTYAVTLASALALTAAGCSSSKDPATDATEGKLAVSAAFYPLEYVTSRVGGPLVEVSTLTKPGAEAHDLELTPKDVAALRSAALIVHLKGFQPALDDALKDATGPANLDVTPAARMDLEETDPEHQDEHVVDPHFWLDPTRLADVGHAVATRLAEIDPTHADTYAANAKALSTDLAALDEEFTGGLKTCANRNLVTGHAAFGYLAQRYQLTQLPISGLSPDQEPNAAQMATIVSEIKTREVKTVFAETLVSPALTETIARQTGAKVAVLDPLEGIAPDSAGTDYPSVMRSNLGTLKTGLECT